MERLKQKVASSSSRVIASLQQAATGTFQSQQPPQQQQQQSAAAAASSNFRPVQETDSPARSGGGGGGGGSVQLGSRLMADADATAHLTEAEREILLEVFKKEEQFQRDTIKLMGSQAIELAPPSQHRLTASNFQLDGQRSTVAAGGHRRSSQRDRQHHGAAAAAATVGLQRQTSTRGGRQQHPASLHNSPSRQGADLAAAAAAGYSSSSTTATPSSRPASSVFGGTPTRQSNRQAQVHQAVGSSGQRASSATFQPQPQQPQPIEPLGQCRICRKFILTSEPCHLCSNCNQFICEDCASYSASDQHWMCSSCRRRATKPAIPADALRELGLNQNSSPVRRMTLRLNQNDLKTLIQEQPGKGSSESNGSSNSNSSSGCSSMSMAVQQQQQPSQTPPSQLIQHQQRRLNQQQQQHQLQRRGSNLDNRASQSAAAAAAAANPIPASTELRFVAQKTLSNPIRSSELVATGSTIASTGSRSAASSQRSPAASASASASASAAATAGTPPSFASSRTNVNRPAPADTQLQLKQQQQQQQQQQQRRASVAVAAAATAATTGIGPGPGTAGDGSARGRGGGQKAIGASRKQSSLQSGSSFAAGELPSATSANYVFDSTAPLQQQQQQPANRQPGERIQPTGGGSNRHRESISSSQTKQQQQQQPRTMITASSELSMGQAPSRRDSNALIPIPPDQIHLRRLSDQSNLVRRSSIIADTMDAFSSMARNRSHSNIDTIQQCTFQQQQFNWQAGGPNGGHHLDYSDENLARDSSYQQQQQHQQQQQQPSAYSSSADYSKQQQQQQPGGRQQLSSIITSYTQKRSSEDLHTDSSSDLDDDELMLQSAQANFEQLDSEQPNEYFAPPRGLDCAQAAALASAANQAGCFVDLASGISIPSVSVSEFSSSQQRLNRINSIQAQQQQQQRDQIMTTPMQINVAIEQAIQQQQHRQSLTQQYLPASDMLSAAAGVIGNTSNAFAAGQRLPVAGTGGGGGGSYLAPRRGSSGRVLPKIPSEQSQSLLDLPTSHAGGATNPGNQLFSANNFSIGAGHHESTSLNLQQQQQQQGSQLRGASTLDLPSLGSAIRRASAPEGQNIKIVVDDMDSSLVAMRSNGCSGGSAAMMMMMMGGMDQLTMHQHQQQRAAIYGKQGELYERLVLYRDDSLDPNTNMARGFGLQVMGGKIDEDDKLQASVVWILAGGPADKVGLKCGDKIIEWDGKCLVNMSYEQVADVIESSANIAELLVKPAHRIQVQANSANVVRSQRRLSHQTEHEHLRKSLQQQARLANGAASATQDQQQQQSAWPNQQQQQQQQQLLGPNLMYQQHQQALSAGNSPLRSGTGRKLPQIPGAQGSFQTGDNTLMIGQLKMASNSTGQLDKQQPHTMNYHGLNGTTASLQQQQLQDQQLWYQQQQQLAYNQQQQSFGAFNPPQASVASHHNQPSFSNLSAPNQDNEVLALIGLQVNVDERVAQLEISVLSAININLNQSLDYYVRLRILPESDRFKACKTLPRSDLNWKETFLFQNFPIEQINRMALEIGIWVYDDAPRLSTQLAQPICEAMISIQSARERNTDFWPLRQPPTSPQARRKSLNDLLETHKTQHEDRFHHLGAQLSANAHSNSNNMPGQWPAISAHGINNSGQPQQYLQQYHLSGQPHPDGFVRARSSSNRNLPDPNKLRAQPRRASDEVAGSSGQRLSSRLSPAASRRSISVINVGGDGPTSSSSRSNSRLGSQGNLIKAQQMRRDSVALQAQHSSSGDNFTPKYGSPKGSVTRLAGDTQQARQMSRQNSSEGVTPSGRRTSLVGIQTMIGYASQKSSLSDASEQRQAARAAALALSSIVRPSSSQATNGGSQRGSSSSNPDGKSHASTTQQQQQQQQLVQQDSPQPPRASACSSVSQSSAKPGGKVGGNGSRRGSVEQGGMTPKLERKGSFAMLTLRKLKRTMSLTKGNDQDANDSNLASRRSSSESEADAGEDLGLTRRLMSHQDNYVGRLKLSFLMTKGQLEIDVISAQGLRYDQESSLGIYVKMYLKGRNKSNKRKTRVVQPWESPVFRQLIKYDGWLVDNKSLEVSVWQKQGGLKGKIPIGFTEIRLSELSLNQLQVSWYNLRSMDIICSSSIED